MWFHSSTYSALLQDMNLLNVMSVWGWELPVSNTWLQNILHLTVTSLVGELVFIFNFGLLRYQTTFLHICITFWNLDL